MKHLLEEIKHSDSIYEPIPARIASMLPLTAQDMLDAGIIETIISEPIGGAHRDAAAAGAGVKDYVTRTKAGMADAWY